MPTKASYVICFTQDERDYVNIWELNIPPMLLVTL